MGHISSSQVNGKLFIDGNLIGSNSLFLNSDSSADPMSYSGAVQLRGTSTKSFSGPINIVRERLELNVTGANAFNSTDITIGSDTGSSRGVLMLIQPNQIPDAANITFKNTSNRYGFFRLNGNNETVSSVSDLTGRAFIENTENSIAYPVNSATLALAGNSDYTFAGRIRDNTIGDPTAPPALTLTKNGTGTLTLTGSATNFGGIQVGAGKLQIGDSASGGVLSSPVTLNNSTSLVFNNHSDAITTCSISGASGSILQRGDGNTRISGHNSYGGGTFIENGKLIAAQPASLPGDVTFNGNGILSLGSDANAVASVTGFGGNGTGWTFNRRDTGSAPASSVTNDVLTITTADNQEGRSVIYNKRVSLMGFSASFRYTPSTSTTAGPADGITFVLENDLRGAGAVGDAGGNLGYRSGSQPILPSFAAELSIYKKGFFIDFNGGGGFYLDLPGWNYSPTNPVPLDITISYDQNQTFSYLIYDGANLLGGCYMGNFGLLRERPGRYRLYRLHRRHRRLECQTNHRKFFLHGARLGRLDHLYEQPLRRPGSDRQRQTLPAQHYPGQPLSGQWSGA